MGRGSRWPDAEDRALAIQVAEKQLSGNHPLQRIRFSETPPQKPKLQRAKPNRWSRMRKRKDKYI